MLNLYFLALDWTFGIFPQEKNVSMCEVELQVNFVYLYPYFVYLYLKSRNEMTLKAEKQTSLLPQSKNVIPSISES